MSCLLCLLAAGLLPVGGWAQTLMGMGAFFNDLKMHPRRIEGSGFAFPAYVKDIEVPGGQVRAPLAVVELGNGKADGVVLTWGANELRCLVPAGDAARLERGLEVAVKGTVVGYHTYTRSPSGLWPVTVHVVTGRCELRPGR